MKIQIKEQIISENDKIALQNRKLFDDSGIFAINIMASPGAGKTSAILAISEALSKFHTIGVIEGDIASRIDTENMIRHGYKAVQINTGGSCHLDAYMVKQVVSKRFLSKLSLVFIENVGNLICPAGVALGSHKNIVIASVPEGDDKPYKYPGIFANADLVILNKSDLIDVFNFNLGYFSKGVRLINQSVPIFPVSCKSKSNIGSVVKWIEKLSKYDRYRS